MVLFIFQWGNPLSKKAKKKLLDKKNKRHQQIFHALRLMRAEAARTKSLNTPAKTKGPGEKKGEWTDKTASIRNKLTGKKRESKERWNRFAGTSGGGGRGL